MLQNIMAHVILVSVEWDVEWVPVSQWDDGSMHICLLGTGRESSCLWLDDGKNSEEPSASHSNSWMVSRRIVNHHGFHLCELDMIVR